MSEKQIEPSKVTKPIQLLAALLVGLILINGSFLGVAFQIHDPSWVSGLLVIAAVINVPLFITSLFLLQTKFRPEMQEDEYYARYLERRYSAETGKTELIEITTNASQRVPARTLLERSALGAKRTLAEIIQAHQTSIEINDLLPQFNEMLTQLRAIGAKPSKTFGTTSDDPIPPKPFVVCVGSLVDIETIKGVIQVTAPFGLEGIAYTDEHISQYRIYIGGYSYDDPKNRFLPVSDEVLKKILAEDFTLEQFYNLVPYSKPSE